MTQQDVVSAGFLFEWPQVLDRSQAEARSSMGASHSGDQARRTGTVFCCFSGTAAELDLQCSRLDLNQSFDICCWRHRWQLNLMPQCHSSPVYPH